MASVERLSQMLRGLTALASARVERLGRRLGLRPLAIRLALAEIPMPRTPLTAAAERAIEGAPRFIVAHSMRTYLWGSLLGIRDGTPVEAEALFLGALLHDLGLVHREGARCFALRGAEQAKSILLAAGSDRHLADRVADAITLHLNVGGEAPTPEARLLQAGAAFDVAGQRFHHVDAATRDEVVAAWPRDGFVTSFSEVIHEEARQYPETRIGFLWHTLGFSRIIHSSDRRFRATRSSLAPER
jgi:hypothetical protein